MKRLNFNRVSKTVGGAKPRGAAARAAKTRAGNKARGVRQTRAAFKATAPRGIRSLTGRGSLGGQG